MRTKNEEVKDVLRGDDENTDGAYASVLIDAEREELELFRAERDKRVKIEELAAEAARKAATSVTINLPPAAGNSIRMSGSEFLHGRTYQVSNDVKWALEEVERRCWSHESSLHESENKGRTKRRAYVG